MRTAETPAPDTTYRIYVQKSTGGDGIVNVIVKARTYPQNVNVELVHESSPTELIDGIINVSSTGHYIFDANHLPNDYNGTMKNTDGGVWIIDGISEEYVRSCADNYLEGRTPFDEFCMQVLRFPQDSEETEFLLKYESN